jgi:hypothetical protein
MIIISKIVRIYFLHGKFSLQQKNLITITFANVLKIEVLNRRYCILKLLIFLIIIIIKVKMMSFCKITVCTF